MRVLQLDPSSSVLRRRMLSPLLATTQPSTCWLKYFYPFFDNTFDWYPSRLYKFRNCAAYYALFDFCFAGWGLVTAISQPALMALLCETGLGYWKCICWKLLNLFVQTKKVHLSKLSNVFVQVEIHRPLWWLYCVQLVSGFETGIPVQQTLLKLWQEVGFSFM